MSPAFPSTAGPRPPDALTLTAWHAGVQKSRGASRPAVCRASLTIDASSHDEPAPARTAILGSFLSDEVDWACGTLAAGPPHHWSHKRDVVRVESDIVFVIDSVACRGAHSTEARFHVGDAQVAIEGNVGRVRYGKAGMTVYALGDVALEAFSAAVESDAARKDAGPAPTARPEFARLKEQPATLAGRAEFTDSVTLPWALVFESSYAPRALPFEAGKGTAVEIRLPGSSDERLLFVALAEWGLARLEGLAFVGRWGLFRFAGGELSRAWGADAWVIEHKGKRLFTRIGNTGGGIIYPTVYESARSIF